MRLRNDCPRFAEYQFLYPSSTRLQGVLCKYYATVVRFYKEAMEVTQRTGRSISIFLGVAWIFWSSNRYLPELTQVHIGFEHFTQAFWKPFELQFGSFAINLKNQCKDVQEEIGLASQQAAFQERQVQVAYRKSGLDFRQKMQQESAEARHWRLQREERMLSKSPSRDCLWMDA